MRRRQLDALALAIGAQQRRSVMLAEAAAALAAQRKAERALAAPATLAADAWFEAAARRLAALAGEGAQSDQQLAALRHAAGDARARLTLLEDADTAARTQQRRSAEKKSQASLDDRSAARIGRS